VGVSRDYPIFSGTPYYLRNGKSYGFQIWSVHSEGSSSDMLLSFFNIAYHWVHPNKSHVREKGAWAYPGIALFFSGTPYFLRNVKSYGFQIWPVHSERPSEQKPIKNWKNVGKCSGHPYIRRIARLSLR